MTDFSATVDAMGAIIATGGTLTSVTLVQAPQIPGYWFTLVDVDDSQENETILFNIQTGSTPIPTGTVFPLYNTPFQNLAVKSISPDAKWEITTNP